MGREVGRLHSCGVGMRTGDVALERTLPLECHHAVLAVEAQSNLVALAVVALEEPGKGELAVADRASMGLLMYVDRPEMPAQVWPGAKVFFTDAALEHCQ